MSEPKIGMRAQDLYPDRRYMRAMSLCAHIMHGLDDILYRAEPHDLPKLVSRKLMDILMEQGVEIITDTDARKPPAHAVGQPQPLPGYLGPTQALYEAQRPFAGLRSRGPSGGIAWRSLARHLGVVFRNAFGKDLFCLIAFLSVDSHKFGQRDIVGIAPVNISDSPFAFVHHFSPSNISVKPPRREAGLRGRLGFNQRDDFDAINDAGKIVAGVFAIFAFGRGALVNRLDFLDVATAIAGEIENGLVGHQFGTLDAINEEFEHFLSPELDRLGADQNATVPKEFVSAVSMLFATTNGTGHSVHGGDDITQRGGAFGAKRFAILVFPNFCGSNSGSGFAHFPSPQSHHHWLETENGRLLTHRQGGIAS